MAHQEYIRNVPGADTVVLFIHGFLGSPDHFQKFIELTPEHYSVYNILLKGHGKEVRDFARASMAEWQKQVEDVVCELSQSYRSIYIVAHSMGTFFAMDASLSHPDTVKGLYLLQSPLQIGVKMMAAKNTLKCFLKKVENDAVGQAYREAHSVTLNYRFWEYLGWVPRYLELFSESKKARDTIKKIKVPCLIFQSAKDELVSPKSASFVPRKENIKLTVLPHSAHFIYPEEERRYLEEMFCNLIGG